MLVLYAMALFWALYYGFMPWLYSGLYTGFHVAGPGRVRRFRRFRRRLGDRRRPPGSGAAVGKFSGAREGGAAAAAAAAPAPGHYSALFFAFYMLYTPLRVCISICLSI